MMNLEERDLDLELEEDVELTDEEILEMTEEDIINKLMEPTEVPEKTYMLDRIGIPVTLQGLSEKDIQRLRRECTKEVGKRGNKRKELNEEEFNAALIEKATVKPNWGSKKLLDQLGLSSGREVIKRRLLAGEMVALGDKVMELSGFDDELEEVDNIKN